eukprot:444316-Hanusia_phi.AAC.1
MNDKELLSLFDKIKLSFEPEEKPLEVIQCKCGSIDIMKDDNLYTCKDCYSIVDIVIDCSAEWRYYGQDDNRSSDPSRCGMPTNVLLPKSSLGSVVGGTNKNSKDLQCVKRLQTWSSMPYNERKLLKHRVCIMHA